VRGWTWTRQPLSNPHPPPRRRRFLIPTLAAATTGPPRRLTARGEGRPRRRAPEAVAVTPMVGYSGMCSGPTRPKLIDNRISDKGPTMPPGTLYFVSPNPQHHNFPCTLDPVSADKN
ncbi:MAG: hypothetical protein LUC93_13760, partial [Planctomycetaceae bacterium]|nr:hypothetical protein [Planctomycetaceae bacterium]